MTLRIAAAALVAASSNLAHAQTAVRYDFAMTVTQNIITGSSHVGSLNGLPVGTQASLSITANNVVVDSEPASTNYQVADASFEMGSFVAGGSWGSYPTTSIVGSLGIGDEARLSPTRTADLFVAFVFLDNPEIVSLATIALADADEVNGERLLFNSTALPLAIDLGLVDDAVADFQIASVQNDPRINFQVEDVAVTVIPTPSGSLVFGAGLLLARRRR
ncbi:MAG: hypothetical protein AAGJ54_11250 [Planctomycetota bacterium]